MPDNENPRQAVRMIDQAPGKIKFKPYYTVLFKKIYYICSK
jgi:hypothetical protein